MVCGAMVLPAPAHELWLVGKDTEPPDRCHPILSYCIGWCKPQTTLLRGARSLGLGTHFDVGGSGPWWTKPFMWNPAAVGGSLSDARVIMMIMRVLVEKLLCQGVTGWIAVLECLLSGARRRLWPRPVVLGTKCCRFPRVRLPCCLVGTKSPVVLGIKCCRFPRVRLPCCLVGTKKPPDVTTGGPGMYRAGSQKWSIVGR
jgi:hypothetical protein